MVNFFKCLVAELFFFDEDNEDTMSIQLFYVVAGLILIWGLGLLMFLPELYRILVSFIPSDFSQSSSDTVWWLFEISKAAPLILKITGFILIVFILPFIGTVLLSDESPVIEDTPALRYFIGYHFILLPFIVIFAWLPSLREILVLLYFLVGYFSILGIFSPTVFRSFKAMILSVLILFQMFLIINGLYPSFFGENFLLYWAASFIVSFGVGASYVRAYKQGKNLANTICTAANPFLYAILLIKFFLNRIIRILTHEDW